jgi:hypothetical protein
MEDHRAHERITNLEQSLNLHMQSHADIESGIAENTRLTKTVAADTAELVALFKGIKGFRTLVMWAAPLIAALMALWAWAKGHV